MYPERLKSRALINQQKQWAAVRVARAPRTRDVRVLLQAADLVDRGEHLAELAEALGKELKLEEHRALVDLQALQERVEGV